MTFFESSGTRTLFLETSMNEFFLNFSFFCVYIGKAYEKVCELCHITVNKIAIFGENGTITPGGVRIGK